MKRRLVLGLTGLVGAMAGCGPSGDPASAHDVVRDTLPNGAVRLSNGNIPLQEPPVAVPDLVPFVVRAEIPAPLRN